MDMLLTFSKTKNTKVLKLKKHIDTEVEEYK